MDKNTPKEVCDRCFGSKEIFNGSEIIPCPQCTDKNSKSKDYQQKISNNLKEVLNEDSDQPIES